MLSNSPVKKPEKTVPRAKHLKKGPHIKLIVTQDEADALLCLVGITNGGNSGVNLFRLYCALRTVAKEDRISSTPDYISLKKREAQQ